MQVRFLILMDYGELLQCTVHGVDICKIKRDLICRTSVLQPSPFFTEQLTAFEVWLEHGSERKKPPEQLPIVLQVSHHTVPASFSIAWILILLDKRSQIDAVSRT